MNTYVHEEQEVKLTGRTAIKEIATAPGKSRILKLVEITPVEDSCWKKWVNPEILYEIQ